MEKGVYTVTCTKCGQPTYVHIDGEGGFDPLRCRSCKIGFLTIEKGEENNEYLATVKEETTVPKEESKKKSKKKSKKGGEEKEHVDGSMISKR